MSKLLLLLCVLLLSSGSFAQKYSFIEYSTEQGLPQSQVTDISQDKDGYLWVATLGGLAKFNGSEFTTFSTNDGLLNNRITALAYIGERLWVGHDGGISYVENNQIKNVGFKGEDKSRGVSEIIQFNDRVIVCTSGGGLHELKGEYFKKIELPVGTMNDIRAAHIEGDHLYLATRGGIVKTRDLVSFKLENGIGEESYYGVTGNSEMLYFCSFSSGVYRKNLKTGFIEHIDRHEVRHALSGSYLDKSGSLWLSSADGVISISHDLEIRFIDNLNGLPVNIVSCFFEDNSGNIWIGSSGKGMFKFPGEMFKYFNQSTGYVSDLFLTGFQSKSGDFYFGTLDQGLLKKEIGSEVRQVDIGQLTIWASVENVDGKNWFGTQNNLVSMDSRDRITEYSEEDGLPGRKITAFYKIGPNEMYIGGSNGVSHYKDGIIKPVGRKVAEPIGTVRDFVVKDDILYCASNLGLFRFEDGGFVSYLGIKDVSYSLEVDVHSSIWVGTEEGLFRIINGVQQRIKIRNNPGSNFINFLNHRNGVLFVGTNNGLFVLTNLESEAPKIQRFGVGEGIVDLESNLNSGFFDQKGNFWFGTASGLVCYHPSQKVSSGAIPKIQLKSILLNNQPFTYTDYSNSIDAQGFPTALSLPYSKNNLIFELDGISLSNHKGLSYQFWLEGLNDGWSPLTSNSNVTFTSLPAGTYSLRMRSVDVDGRISDEIIVPFVVNEAFYKTSWFIALCILIVLVILLVIFRVRVRRINEINAAEKMTYKSRLLSLEQQSMNASMNRHFVFNSLNSIQYFINTQDRFSANKYLTNFANLIRKNLDSATSEGNMVTLDEELERLELYLSLESMRFKDKFEYFINAENVDCESIQIPAMIMQPFVENSIIHGILPNTEKMGLITIDVKVVDGYLLLSIEDNGVGVNHSISNKVELDGDHRSKGMEITSKRIELLQKVSSNDITLDGPYEVKDIDGSINGTHVLLKISLED
ncbi:MAG: ligand-binding sensor domain-containing protein/two-component sensor histidine kinase [Crocinitomicaceae bacterium]|jgi:ligand-binding sensor domain-containing protein/two-component sensor histidine kinase